MHVDIIFFAHHGPDYVAKVFGNRISKGLSDQLAGILDGEFDFAFRVPLATDIELSLADPLGIELYDALNFKIIFNVEFLQSEPDCEELVPSFRIEPDLAAEILHGFDFRAHDMLPGFIITQEHTVIFSRPPFGAVCPIHTRFVQYFP
jgi:hypothetical protein